MRHVAHRRLRERASSCACMQPCHVMLCISFVQTTQVLDRLSSRVHEVGRQHFGAFYSSEMGGIVTNPALMVIHMDDHMVHRGHGVVDTVPLRNGQLHQLPRHLELFTRYMHSAGIAMPLSVGAMSRIIIDTVKASKKPDGMC